MTPTLYYVVCAVLSVTVLLGISMMSRVKTAVRGNIISAASVLAGIVVTLLYNRIASVGSIYVYMLVGVVIGSAFAVRVKMIQMPQLVALLNGVGGLASALVGILTLLGVGQWVSDFPVFSNVTGSAIRTGEEARALALRQITEGVRWTDEEAALAAFIGTSAARALETGPGKVLQGLWKDANPTIPCQAAGTCADIDALTGGTNAS